VPDPADLVVRRPADVVAFLEADGIPPVGTQLVLGLAVAEADPRGFSVCALAVRAEPGDLDARQLTDLAAVLQVGTVVLVTIGLAGPPSRAELTRFVTWRRHCADDGVVLLDWITHTGRVWWSSRERIVHETA
jgi:hypothetical protein